MSTCEIDFICADKIEIMGIVLLGTGWFVIMLLVAFGLQISANFMWLINSQISREILQLKKNDNKRTILIWKSVGWTALSTFLWIVRIVLIMGNNIWIYVVILLGNIVGTYWSSINQVADEDTSIDTLINALKKGGAQVDELRQHLKLTHPLKMNY